jgi:diguanylate cyclase
MRYFESKEKTAELLRLAVPHMAGQAAGFHPISYTIWYEHLAKINPALQSALDVRLAEKTPLSEQETYELFTKYIVNRDTEITERLEAQLTQVLVNVRQSAANLGQQAAQYNASLTRHEERLQQQLDVPTLGNLIATLVGETTRMRTSAQTVQEEMGATSAEVSRLREQLEKAQGQALFDALTELHNRRAFEQSLAQMLTSAVENASPCSLLMLDIDNFKQVNDTYGHVFGDKVIRYVAQRISLSIKGRDVAARYGGEEFAILLPDTTVQGAAVLAEQIRLTVARGKIHRVGTTEPIAGVTVSVGVAESLAGDTVEELTGRADQALYKSKQAGRNRVTVAATAKTQ